MNTNFAGWLGCLRSLVKEEWAVSGRCHRLLGQYLSMKGFYSSSGEVRRSDAHWSSDWRKSSASRSSWRNAWHRSAEGFSEHEISKRWMGVVRRILSEGLVDEKSLMTEKIGVLVQKQMERFQVLLGEGVPDLEG